MYIWKTQNNLLKQFNLRLMEEFIETPQNERPTSLTVISILSWIADGIIFFSFGLLMLMKNVIIESKDEILAQNQSVEVEEAFNLLINNFSLVVVYPFLLNILSIVGVFMMFKLKKIGFHIYTSAHLGLIVISYLLSGEISWTGLLFSISFIGLYASNLKVMK